MTVVPQTLMRLCRKCNFKDYVLLSTAGRGRCDRRYLAVCELRMGEFLAVASVTVQGQREPAKLLGWSSLERLSDEACSPGSLCKFHSLIIGKRNVWCLLPVEMKRRILTLILLWIDHSSEM